MTMKNSYSLPLISELLDRLEWVKKFTQTDLTNVYLVMSIIEYMNEK